MDDGSGDVEGKNVVEDDEVQEKDLISFDRAEEYRSLLFSSAFVAGGLGRYDDEEKQSDQKSASKQGNLEAILSGDEQLKRMMAILDEYQEQSYLLDPYLESIVTPPVQALRAKIKAQGHASSHEGDRLARLIYYYTKVRGYKTILHFFPHDVDDLLPTLTALEGCIEYCDSSIWETRYMLLLWLSLICMIPFDLHQFDVQRNETTTIARVERIGKHYLSSPGKEREAASNLLSKLYQRQEAKEENLRGFLRWAQGKLHLSAQPTTFLVTGIVQTLCNIVKVSTSAALEMHLLDIRGIARLLDSQDSDLTKDLVDNSVVNKYKSKMACRLGLKLLSASKMNVQPESTLSPLDRKAEDFDVPEEVDAYIATLLDFLRDKDTIVRYSAAKGIARISARLPTHFVDQIAEEITSMFSSGIGDFMGKGQDLSGVSEHTWQGCCLALAELARRGLLSNENLDAKILWIEKALLFDIRRGAHSVGTGVRDAACYVIWAMARSHDAEALRPHASSLSQKLICVSLFDRDISIRRAASAAFQESVGRLGIFPCGIEVIRKTDFYAVGVRRSAYLTCAPSVAEHAEYRLALIDHLIDVSLEHWDEAIRILASGALARIIDFELSELGANTLGRLISKITTKDQFALHGVLSALSEIGKVCQRRAASMVAVDCCNRSLNALEQVKKPSPRLNTTNMILRSICELIANNITHDTSLPMNDAAIAFIDMAMTRPDERCHDAAAEAISQWSAYDDLSDRIEATVGDWQAFSIAQKQANALALGAYRYSLFPTKLSRVINHLLSVVNQTSPNRSLHIETRRNCISSLSSIFADLQGGWHVLFAHSLFLPVSDALLAGLDDYSTDARGDVGSWVRIASMRGIEKIVETVVSFTVELSDADYDQLRSTGDRILAGLARQTLERIELVRETAKQSLLNVLGCYDSLLKVGHHKAIPTTFSTVRQIFGGIRASVLSGTELYGRVVQLLKLSEVRAEILRGIVVCIGPQRESLNRDMASALSDYVLTSSDYGLDRFTEDLHAFLIANIRSNRTFTPGLQTLNVLLDAGAYDDRCNVRDHLLAVLQQATRSIDKVKSVPRILAAAQYVTNLLRVAAVRTMVADHLPAFLLHPFPTIRSSFAELLYVQWQSCVDDLPEEAEELLLSVPWSQGNKDHLSITIAQLQSLLRSIV